ncbi:5'/3'-nucleotidase SurE [Thiomicrorhabdus xiamenensis]|uniref:5'-nucleotidase SurE n=1 Tax=Thiomicrorhabdus xiamenensis TaxID=2739063 RepID=A0A7D4P4V7_9GAMM|nr:5'/3'-nucleotidase SurE [Thiomicrorhabdus xiamenensis]QKI89195.1 5'/3'-nucleotidase SurE [Thiomicrorhabdus xiamenensis]
MKILISNDDGHFAPGIQTLLQSLQGHPTIQSLTLIAPDRNRSAASNSLTLVNPLRLHLVKQDDEKNTTQYSVNGTPTDCVHLGVNGALGFQPDMVISGINAGANMGDDVLYSGTVAAATEGRFLGKPSIAISLCGETNFDSAAHYFLRIFNDLADIELASDTILNINIPDLPLEQIKGFKVTRLGRRHASEPVVSQLDPRGLPIHWIGPAGSAADSAEDTDFYAVEHGYVSITPLKIDLTHYQALQNLKAWADRISD